MEILGRAKFEREDVPGTGASARCSDLGVLAQGTLISQPRNSLCSKSIFYISISSSPSVVSSKLNSRYRFKEEFIWEEELFLLYMHLFDFDFTLLFYKRGSILPDSQ